MPDTSDLYNTPAPRFSLFRHPLVLMLLAALLCGVGYLIHRRALPAAAAVPTPAKPNGDWIGEITMDGREWQPTIDGDTPGPHRHAVFHFHLETTDSFLDHHAGDGSMRIVGEPITRTFRAYGWELRADGSLKFGFDATPTLFPSEFDCEVDGSNLTCKSDDPLKFRLSLHPGTPADAEVLLRQVTQRAASEVPLVPYPKTHEYVLCTDDYETQTVGITDDDPRNKPTRGGKQRKPPPCHRSDED